MTQTSAESPRPWWTFGHVWMVIAGPAIVVVASFVTFYLAASKVDPVLEDDASVKQLQMEKSLADNPSSLAPALQGRNHAATGVPPERSKAP